MKLTTAVRTYLDYKHGLGMKFFSEGFIFAAFCRALGNIDIAHVAPAKVWRFLCPTGRQTRGSEIKYFALRGFYRFAMARGYVSRSPLPARMTTLPQVLVPHIYSRDELARLLRLASARYMRIPRVEPKVIRALIILMYGAALRTSEALGLDLADVDLRQRRLLVRNTKFYKTRLVVLGGDLTIALARYLDDRNKCHSTAPTAPVFVFRKGQRLSRHAADRHFRQLCRLAGFGVPGGTPNEPRLHDLRHSAIVHRVLAWYRDGRDVQALLPKLATYVGHKDVACTQRYLRLIPELLDEANRRFAAHAREVYSHA
jgi:site-specific recombinase XerD